VEGFCEQDNEISAFITGGNFTLQLRNFLNYNQTDDVRKNATLGHVIVTNDAVGKQQILQILSVCL
jgi:hypothetical protein